MPDRLILPTRNVLAVVSQNDQRMIKWFEDASGTVNGLIASNVGGGGGGYSVDISGALERIRFTTSNGIDTFDSGSVNVMWE